MSAPPLAHIVGGGAGSDDAAMLDVAAQAPPGAAGLLMLPHLYGERAPHWATGARGTYAGLTHGHGREHLARAAVEGVCLHLAVVLDAVEAAGVTVTEVRGTGGFARSQWWRQLLTDVLGRHMGFCAGVEGSAVGAALLGFHALGDLPDLDAAADLEPIIERHSPGEEATAVYARLRPVYTAIDDAVAPLVRALGAVDAPPAPGYGAH